MTNEAKPTAGLAKVEAAQLIDISGRSFPIVVDGYGVALVSAWEKSGEEARAQGKANANLIEDAFNVHHKTGLTPRELADQRAELLAALEEAVAHYGRPGGPWNVLEGTGSWITKARAAIAKARGGSDA